MSPWKNPVLEQTLANLKVGQSAAVLEITAQGQQAGLRLQELGLVAGAPLSVLSNSQGVMIQVGAQRLCLREELAQAVAVLPL